MKKIAGKIAIILILVILANSFAGCTIMLPVFAGSRSAGLMWLGFAIDLTIAGVVALIVASQYAEAPNPNEEENRIYLANAEHNPLTEYDSVMEKLNSLPETERVLLLEKINSLSEKKRASLVRTINSLPAKEIAASIERLNSLSETELTQAVQTFYSLSETELDLVTDKLNDKARSLPEVDYVASAQRR